MHESNSGRYALVNLIPALRLVTALLAPLFKFMHLDAITNFNLDKWSYKNCQQRDDNIQALARSPMVGDYQHEKIRQAQHNTLKSLCYFLKKQDDEESFGGLEAKNGRWLCKDCAGK